MAKLAETPTGGAPWSVRQALGGVALALLGLPVVFAIVLPHALPGREYWAYILSLSGGRAPFARGLAGDA